MENAAWLEGHLRFESETGNRWKVTQCFTLTLLLSREGVSIKCMKWALLTS